MRKFLLLSVLAIAMAFTVNAQTKKDSVLTQMATDVCAELKGKKLTPANMQTEIGMAMMPVFTKYLDQLKDYYDLDNMDAEVMQKMGLEVMMKLATVCPESLKAITESAGSMRTKPGAGIPLVQEKTVVATNVGETMTGTLTKITTTDFTSIEVKDASGKVNKLWWFEYFEGAEKLTATNLNKKISVNFIEKEIYNATLKQYIKTKILIGVK